MIHRIVGGHFEIESSYEFYPIVTEFGRRRRDSDFWYSMCDISSLPRKQIWQLSHPTARQEVREYLSIAFTYRHRTCDIYLATGPRVWVHLKLGRATENRKWCNFAAITWCFTFKSPWELMLMGSMASVLWGEAEKCLKPNMTWSWSDFSVRLSPRWNSFNHSPFPILRSHSRVPALESYWRM